jgi:hypothetical protein
MNTHVGGSFVISWGRYGGFYWSHDYCTRLCLGWIAFTFYPFDFDGFHDRQVDRTISLMDAYCKAVAERSKVMECYHEAMFDAVCYRGVLDDLYGAVLHDMTARNLPHEWAPDSAMARASKLLEKQP